MTEEPLVRGDARGRTLDLALARFSAQLPDQLTHLGDRLGGNRFSEARQAAARVDGDATPDGGVAVAQELFGFTGLAEADVLVPVEFEGR